MKCFVIVLLVLTIFAVLCQDSDAGVALNRNTRASCWGGELGCAANCMRRGRYNGGCCGESYTRCHGTCYCNGSGYEHRCYDCDLK